jgi:REP element-mobilizing transposase RayT
MGKYIVIVTNNYHPINLLRYDNESLQEKAYQHYKEKGYGVIKAVIEKAHELNIVTV